MLCPLCESQKCALFYEREDKRYGTRVYIRCGECRLIFLSPEHRFDLEQEKTRYDTHENDPNDPGYVAFLSKLANPLNEQLKPSAQGLDFGCGPGPTMKVILEEKGHHIENYDPIYFFNEALLLKQYDFITCTEAIEHFYQPKKEFDLLKKCLKPNGILGIMTEVLHDEKTFPDWWYHKDPTHVCFYQPQTFEWIAQYYNWKNEPVSKNVVFFKQL